MRMKLRYWMIVGMLIIMIVPRLFYEVPGILDRYIFNPSQAAQQQTAMDKLVHAVSESEATQWGDAEWRDSITNLVSSLHLGVVLSNASGQELFRFVPSGSENNPTRQIAFSSDGRLEGTMNLYGPRKSNGWGVALSVIAAACVIVMIGWKIGRVVVKPLEAASAAARRIGSGDLDFDLPKSTVAEVVDVRTAFHAMRDELREALIRQSGLEEERRFFISAIAHDLRTPIFTLRGFLLRMEKGMDSSQKKLAHYLEICSKKAEQLDRLVSDLFSYTRMESLEQTMQSEQVELNGLLKDIMNEYIPAAREKEIDLRFEGLQTEVVLHADPHLLRRAIGNLLDNALLYTPRKGEVSLICHAEKNKVLFSIKDTGPGISGKDRDHIFEPFYRGDESRNPEYGGTGLGLTIARRILRAHGGELTATNNETAGSVFTGWLPLL